MSDCNDPSTPPFKTIDAASPPAAGALAPISPSNLDSDITDELTDHLSLAARDLQLAGHTSDEAQQLAHQRFGDIASIRRRLWWIHQGDELMLRTALAIVCVVLVIAVAALGIGNWRMSRTIDDLHSTLVTMNENQQKLTDSQQKIIQNVNRPLTIAGRLYFGDPAKPVGGARIDLYSFPDGRLIDEFASDFAGRFETKPLPAGKYYLIAPLLGLNPTLLPTPSLNDSQRSRRSWQSTTTFASSRDEPRPLFGVQSSLIELSPFGKTPEIDLDVRMIPVGQLTYDLPQRERRIYLRLKESDAASDATAAQRGTGRARGRSKKSGQTKPLTDEEKKLAANLSGKGIDIPDWLFPRLHVVLLKSEPELPELSKHRVDAGSAGPVAGVYNGRAQNSEVWPIAMDLHYLRRFSVGPQNFYACDVGNYEFGAYFVLTSTQGIPARFLGDYDHASLLPADQRIRLEVQDGKRTHVHVVISDDFEKNVVQALENVSNQADFDALLNRAWPLRAELAGYEEMNIPDDVMRANERLLERFAE
jgi:hypothetical protein